jgi:2'-5' RNA ligase
LHITMIEFCLGQTAEVHRIVSLLKACLPIPLASQSIDIVDTGILGDRVLFAEIGEGLALDRLCELRSLFEHGLRAAGFEPLGRADFRPHVTVCKAPRGGFSVDPKQALHQNGFSGKFGSQPFTELCLCCKRSRDEKVPPVICRLRVG